MTSSTQSGGLGGGVFLTLGPVIGYFAGGRYGEPIIGILTGLALGIIAAALFWWMRR